MHVGNGPYEVDRIDPNGAKLPPKKFGKYFRESNDPLVVRQETNDPTLPWAKELANAWHIDARKNHKNRLIPTLFEDIEAYEAAIESGEYFSSPDAALAAKKARVNKKVNEISEKLSENSEEIQEVAKKRRVKKEA